MKKSTFQPRSLSLIDLSYTVIDRDSKQDKILLHPLTAVVKAGQSLAIMGPSGSGKSTLMEVMGNRLSSGRIGGQILLNGSKKRSSRQIKFVPQIDVLPGFFSCEELLYYAAQLSLPVTMTEEEKTQEIEATLTDLGLLSCRHTKVGNVFIKGLSGGQIKRLAIALELIARPSILLLDEPTSGLDSKAALSLCSKLRDLTQLGHTIILSIHQPSAELMSNFDNLCLLARGHCMYFGPVKEVRGYFDALSDEGIIGRCPEYTNPFDFFIYVINDDFDEGKMADLTVLSQKFDQSSYATSLREEVAAIGTSLTDGDQGNLNGELVETVYATPRWHQVRILTKRQFVACFRDYGYLWARIAVCLLLSFVVGTIYYNLSQTQRSIPNRVSSLLFVDVFMSWMVLGGCIFFVECRRVFERERANGLYATDSFVLSMMAVSIVFVFLLAIDISMLVYPLCDYNGEDGRYGWYLLQLYETLFVSEMIALCLSAVINDFIIIMGVLSAYFGALSVTAGLFILLRTIPWYWRWLHYISQFSYGFRMAMRNELEGMTFIAHPPQPVFVVANNITTYTCPGSERPLFSTGEEVLDFYSVIDRPLYQDAIILAAIAVMYAVIYYAILYKFVKGKK